MNAPLCRRSFLVRSVAIASGITFTPARSLFSRNSPTITTPSILKAGEPIDYGPLAFQPQVWKQKNRSTMLHPWEGKEIVFLTTSPEFDPELMSKWVDNLDRGWKLYAELTGARPRPFKLVNGKPCIAAVPGPEYSCGVGCGYVGATGIEIGKFYEQDYPAFRKNPMAMPHYVFYEMGRNFFTFGDRHSCFTTGFAVFMRYICMDLLKADDDDAGTRKVIQQAELHIRTSSLSFFKMFTNADGMNEKQPRLDMHPSDQPVTFASAMLRLYSAFGKNDWLKTFYKTLSSMKLGSPESSLKGARQQAWNWLIAASLGAKRDLAPIYVNDWRMPLAKPTVEALARVDWKTVTIETLATLNPEWV